MAHFSRRDFLKTTAGAAGVMAAGGGAAVAASTTKSATDLVPLGNSGVEVTRLAFGTGTFGGRVQRELGQEPFTKLVRHAYDRGIRFFESADSYGEMHEMLAQALKGIPRDSYKLMTKFRLTEADKPKETIERYRRELQSDYFDILLMHCVRNPDWPEHYARLEDAISEAKEKGIVRAKGASCHGLLPLRRFPESKWLDVVLLRVNNDGTKMDALNGRSKGKGDVAEVTAHIKQLHDQGKGVLGMKIMGEGRFKTPEQRDASIKYVMGLGTVDAVTIGYKSTAEIDEAIERITKHLNT